MVVDTERSDGIERRGLSRRDLIKASAVAGAAAWTAPVIIDSLSSPAAALSGPMYRVKFLVSNCPNQSAPPPDNISCQPAGWNGKPYKTTLPFSVAGCGASGITLTITDANYVFLAGSAAAARQHSGACDNSTSMPCAAPTTQTTTSIVFSGQTDFCWFMAYYQHV